MRRDMLLSAFVYLNAAAAVAAVFEPWQSSKKCTRCNRLLSSLQILYHALHSYETRVSQELM